MSCCEQSKAAIDDSKQFTTWHGISRVPPPILPVVTLPMFTSAMPFSGVGAYPDALHFHRSPQLGLENQSVTQLPSQSMTQLPFQSMTQLPFQSITQLPFQSITQLPSQSITQLSSQSITSNLNWSRSATAQSGTVGAANEISGAVSSSSVEASAPLTLVKVAADGHCLYSAFCTILGTPSTAQNIQFYRDRAADCIEQLSSFTDEVAKGEGFSDKAAYVAGVRKSVHGGCCEIDVLAESLGVGLCALYSSDGKASKRLMPDKLLFKSDRKRFQWGIVLRSVLQKSKQGHYDVLSSGGRFLFSYDELERLTLDLSGVVRRHSRSSLSDAALTSDSSKTQESASGKGLLRRCFLIDPNLSRHLALSLDQSRTIRINCGRQGSY